MKIAFVTKTRGMGGAEIAVERLSYALKRHADCDVNIFVRNQYQHGPDTTSFAVINRWTVLLFSMLDALGYRGEQWAQKLHTRLMIPRLMCLLSDYAPDIVHLHNINQWSKTGFHRSVVFRILRRFPVAWTLHDLWPTNGKYCYPPSMVDAIGTSERESDDEDSVTHRMFNADNLALISPSRWVADSVHVLAPENRCMIETIPHGLDLSVFRPLAGESAAGIMNVLTDRPVVFCAAANLSQRRKGMDFMCEALDVLSAPVCLLTIGKGHEAFTINARHMQCNLGELWDERLLALAYNCADVVVVPSRKETFGNVAMEALACGRPLIAFKDSGVDEMIQPGITGDVVNEWSGAALARSIDKMLPIAKGMSSACRQYAEQHFSFEQYADRHMQLYRKLLSAT